MKKAIKLISLICAVVLVVSFCACNNTNNEAKPANDPVAKVTDEPAKATEEPAKVTEAPTAAPTEAPTEVPTPVPTPEPTEAPKKTFDETVLDFEEYTVGDLMLDIEQLGKWGFTKGGTANSVIADENGSKIGLIKYDSIWYDDVLPDGIPYTLSLDFRNEGAASQFGGFLLNWSDETEEDRNFALNNGMNGDGMHTIVGRSGIGFSFNNDNPLYIYTITYDEAKDSMSYKEAEIQLETAVRTNWCKVVLHDDGKGTVTLTIDEKLVATVTYADAAEIKGSDLYTEKYYRTFKVANAAGEEVLSVNNAVIATSKTIAIGGRNHYLHLDNIKIENK